MFRKTAFYYHLKQASAGTIETPMTEDSPCPDSLYIDSTVAATILSSQSDTVTYLSTPENLSISTADEDIICDSENTCSSDVYTDQMNVAVNTSVHCTYQEEDPSYQNRAERRSVQRLELRKIRTGFKKYTRSLTEGNKHIYYNAKMFRKTAFYCHLKQASAGMIETPMIEDSPFSASLSVGSDTTESNLSIITADKNQMTEDIICYSQNTYTSDNYTDQMNAAVNTSVRYTYQEEITSLQTDTAMTLYSSKYTPFNGINKEDPVRVVSDHTDQAVEGTPVAAICKEECLQASTLVLLDNLDHAVESTHVVDIAEEGLSSQTDAHVPLGDIEKVSEGVLVTEDTSLQTDTIMPLTIDMDIPTALTMNMDICRKLQARTDALVHATDPDDAEIGEEKEDTEPLEEDEE
ncbi:hypothetical protein INT48_000912 [Thamnidium elegans]|uniref:Uncharacterized protein n=1 Tax=Thamnidium elegans TaxID=101142 RepID=A0A8H7SGN1_9FUNG|nr:hypothetical protein INT48_000912 [Thamnidium elegans]